MNRTVRQGAETRRLAFSRRRIMDAVDRLAGRVHEDLDCESGVTFVVMLKGGARFGFDLLGRYPGKYYFDFVGVSSYGGEKNSSGEIELYLYRLNPELINGRRVVLLDDIGDTGATFIEVMKRIRADFSPEVLATCALIWREGSAFTPDYHEFLASTDHYFVGYGLGLGEEDRHLNDIYMLVD